MSFISTSSTSFPTLTGNMVFRGKFTSLLDLVPGQALKLPRNPVLEKKNRVLKYFWKHDNDMKKPLKVWVFKRLSVCFDYIIPTD